MSLYEQFIELAEKYIDTDSITNEFKNFFGRLEEENIHDFTALQKDVFSRKDFWDSEKNIIVQGATSAGKTLTAEINMAYQIYCLDKKVIFLVPLKALAYEKWNSMSKKFPDMRVYYSTADYQNDDMNIVRNNYDIAVMVYEKFYSLMSQNENAFKKTGLLVIDELHVLNDKERGPKLEFSVEKFRTLGLKEVSILAMTTTECDVENVLKWFGENETTIIFNDERPVEIEERFVYLDPLNNQKNLYKRYNKNVLQSKDDEKFPLTAGIREKNNPDYTLFQIIAQHLDKQIIVFCNSKYNCEELVKKLCKSNLLKPLEEKDNSFISYIDSDMEENHYDSLKTAVTEYAVAYHNARLPAVIREDIESRFADGKIQILISTETLTMGMNMPTDVMICYNNEVWRSENKKRKLNYQEYKNIIGRCGRYGIKANGISYMITEDERDFKKSIRMFAEEPKNEIIKSGTERNAEALAPYYLNLFNKDKAILSKALIEKIKKGLFEKPQSDDTAEEIISLWYNGIDDEDCEHKNGWLVAKDPERKNAYAVNEFGKAIRCFALSLDTYDKIYRYFIDKDYVQDTNLNFSYKLPDYEEEPYKIMFDGNEKKNYLLDVLIVICRNMSEVADKNQYLSFDSDDKKYISEFIQSDKIEENMYWTNSAIEAYKNDPDIFLTPVMVVAMYRAFVLYYWIKGYNVTQIRKTLGLPDYPRYYIYTSEVKSLGEICAYILEAVSKAMRSQYKKTQDKLYRKLADMFYNVSICIKYGMNSDLTKIANKHIRGLSRNKLLEIKEAADKEGQSPIDFLYWNINNLKEKISLSTNQINEIRKICDRKYDISIKQALEEFIDISEDFQSDYEKAVEAMTNDEWRVLIGFNFGLTVKKEDDRCIDVDNGKLKLYIYHTEIKEGSDTNCSNILTRANVKTDEDYLVLFQGSENYQPEDILKSYNNSIMSVEDFSKLIIFRIIEHKQDKHTVGDYLIPVLEKVKSALNNDFESIEKRQKAIFDTVAAYKFDDDNTEQALSTQKALSADTITDTPVMTSVTNIGTQNNYYLTKNDVTQNNFTQNNFIQNNTSITINNIKNIKITRIETSKSEEDKARALNETEKSIKDNIPVESAENQQEMLRKFTQNVTPPVAPEYDIVKKLLEGDFCKDLDYALYVHKSFNDFSSDKDDFSPAIVMYGKFLESYLKKYFIGYVQEKYPNFNMSLSKNGQPVNIQNITDELKEKMTLGTFFSNCPRLKNFTKNAKFQELEDFLRSAKDYRNKTCHEGEKISRTEAVTQRNLTFGIIRKMNDIMTV